MSQPVAKSLMEATLKEVPTDISINALLKEANMAGPLRDQAAMLRQMYKGHPGGPRDHASVEQVRKIKREIIKNYARFYRCAKT
jgi:hypothetical protein